MSDIRLDTHLEPDQIAQFVYNNSDYPAAYKVVVAKSYAKQDQYAQIVSHIPLPKSSHERLTILEPAPSNVPLLKNALRNAHYPEEQIRLIGLDPYPRMHPSGMEMLTASVTSIPLDENSVDVVVMSSVLFFVTEYVLAIEECRRVLKPDGLLILSEPDTQTRSSLSKKVMQYEVEAIRHQIMSRVPGWGGKLIYPLAVVSRFLPRLFHLRSAVQINKQIVAQQKRPEGFTEDELVSLFKRTGLVPTVCERSYADSYLLLVGRKANVAEVSTLIQAD